VHWERRGLVLAGPPAGLEWAKSHVALPAAIPKQDSRIRLFFSTRDERGRSHVGRADLILDAPARELTVDPVPVLAPGPLGAFDDSGVTVSCVVGAGARQLLYYSGWSLGRTVPFYFYIGCAESEDDGNTFRRVSPAPVLERSEVDPYLTASPWVLHENGSYRMWYVSGTGWSDRGGTPRHRYHIKYAESSDGLRWQRNGHVCIDYRDESEYAFGRPCVIRDGSSYRMWYAYRGDRYRIGYAESADGLTWRRLDDQAGIGPSLEGWDSEMIEYPCVFDAGGRRHMLYNGNDYGRTGIGWAVLQADRSPMA
jgi:hypothetical protein